MLLARGRAGDGARALEQLAVALTLARELGMKPLVERALALKLRAQSVVAPSLISLDAVVSAVQDEPPDLSVHAAPDGTVTILFTDIQDWTGLTEQLGDQRAQRVLHAHNQIVRAQVRHHGGFEVKSQGDGFMLTFQSARNAVLCAIALQQEFARFNERHPDTPLHVRMGLHAGEAIKEKDDFFGRAVIMAARIAASAKGGEILISSLLKDLTGAAGDLRIGAGRKVGLKGLHGLFQVHPLTWSDATHQA
jgi:class 3 adenylate cyclase